MRSTLADLTSAVSLVFYGTQARITSPQQRTQLQGACAALEAAGLSPEAWLRYAVEHKLGSGDLSRFNERQIASHAVRAKAWWRTWRR